MINDFRVSTPTVRCSPYAGTLLAGNFIDAAVETALENCKTELQGACGIKVDETNHNGPDKEDTEFTIGCTEAKSQECSGRIHALLDRIEQEFPYVEQPTD